MSTACSRAAQPFLAELQSSRQHRKSVTAAGLQLQPGRTAIAAAAAAGLGASLPAAAAGGLRMILVHTFF
jgi:hypothetical protein